MAITRRQFVTRLGAMTAAVGLSQTQLAQLSEVFAHNASLWGTNTGKPKVLWIHGAECTGCSTSVLGLFENAAGKAVEDDRLMGAYAGTTLAGALGLVGNLDGDILGVTGTASPLPAHGHRTINMTKSVTGVDFDGEANADTAAIVNLADVLIDFISLEYHETVNSAAGDLAYAFLADHVYAGGTAAETPYVLVVEGAVQLNDATSGFLWAADEGGVGAGAPWCSIGADVDAYHGGTPSRTYTGQQFAGEISFQDAAVLLACNANCVCSISIGQCATFGGYPACVSPKYNQKQTPAFGVYDAISQSSHVNKAQAMRRHVRVPGCPTNPWWFALTVVLWLVDASNGPLAAVPGDGPLGIVKQNWDLDASAVDNNRRLKHVYGTAVHGPGCQRYSAFTAGDFAVNPGDSGCLLNLGCKGPMTNSLCSLHGWNGRQPRNESSWDDGVRSDTGGRGGFCVTGGHPCMGCTEKGYPDSFVPFVER